ncbi:polysaccharide deacetylase family protein [Clostridium tertium]|uniref:polysaccharide deacetylase family protein n=1 Tax=Clostridium tertium TaxID=1559 RepID=UPI0024B33B98|nr:polysaccharide deacetylase family protein [Clostridium tertium]MDI9216390.1 polysaccharide deacetylase [Clostridium tertium]
MVNIKKFSKFISFIALFIFLNNINYIPVSALYTENHLKTVYLTFDDGPSVNVTKELINILNDNNIKATFFVVGDYANIYPYMIKSLNENGMCIMPHCNIHDYVSVYKSEENYFKDLDKCRDTIESILGKRNLNFIRLPGGSNNTVCDSNVLSKIKNRIVRNGDYYIDWTIAAGDSEAKDLSSEFINSRIKDEGGLYDVEVVLMHDLGDKYATVDSLQEIINFYKEKGYKFKTLNEIENWEIQYLKDINVLNK